MSIPAASVILVVQRLLCPCWLGLISSSAFIPDSGSRAWSVNMFWDPSLAHSSRRDFHLLLPRIGEGWGGSSQPETLQAECSGHAEGEDSGCEDSGASADLWLQVHPQDLRDKNTYLQGSSLSHSRVGKNILAWFCVLIHSLFTGFFDHVGGLHTSKP